MTPGDRYSYRVCWSAEDEAYVGTVDELPSLSWVADSLETALAGVRDLVTDVFRDVAYTGAAPPAGEGTGAPGPGSEPAGAARARPGD